MYEMKYNLVLIYDIFILRLFDISFRLMSIPKSVFKKVNLNILVLSIRV